MEKWSPSQEMYDDYDIGHGGSRMSTIAPEDRVFVSPNATLVRAHIGSTAVMDCRVKKGMQYGMVSGGRKTSNVRCFGTTSVVCSLRNGEHTKATAAKALTTFHGLQQPRQLTVRHGACA